MTVSDQTSYSIKERGVLKFGKQVDRKEDEEMLMAIELRQVMETIFSGHREIGNISRFYMA
jgi:hypothetical protein